jgi:hypothetical protein
VLDVKCGEEVYVLEYLPRINEIGLSRQSTAVFGWEGFEQTFESFEAARQAALNLLGEPTGGGGSALSLELAAEDESRNSFGFARQLMNVFHTNETIPNQLSGLRSTWGHIERKVESGQALVKLTLEVGGGRFQQAHWVELTLTPEIARKVAALLDEGAEEATGLPNHPTS